MIMLNITVCTSWLRFNNSRSVWRAEAATVRCQQGPVRNLIYIMFSDLMLLCNCSQIRYIQVKGSDHVLGAPPQVDDFTLYHKLTRLTTIPPRTTPCLVHHLVLLSSCYQDASRGIVWGEAQDAYIHDATWASKKIICKLYDVWDKGNLI